MVRIISTHKHCTFLEKLASQFNSPELNKRNSMCGFLAVSSSSGPLLLLLEAPLASSLTAAFSSLPPPPRRKAPILPCPWAVSGLLITYVVYSNEYEDLLQLQQNEFPAGFLFHAGNQRCPGWEQYLQSNVTLG